MGVVDTGGKYISPTNVVSSLQKMDRGTIRNIVGKFSIDVDIMIINCNGDINVGMMFRNSFIFGVPRIWIVGRKRFDPRSSVGAHHYLTVNHVPVLRPEFFDENNLTPVFIEQGGENLYNFKWERFNNRVSDSGVLKRMCIIMGNEHSGIDPLLLSAFPNNIVSIPQIGWTRSLNVAVANGIVLNEYQRHLMKRSEM